MNRGFAAPAALLAALLLLLPALALGQIRTVGGDPLLAVTNPAKAVPAGEKKARAKPLAMDQNVRLVEEKAGMALVAAESATPENGRDIFYRLPMAALHTLPGRTHLDRPDWLPAPALAEVALRDVVAYEDAGSGIMLATAGAKPKRLIKGRLPAVSPDGSTVAISPDDGQGVLLLSLGTDGKRTLLAPGSKAVMEKSFSPDGKRLAWRTGDRIELADPARPDLAPTTVASQLKLDMTLQGFTRDGSAVVLQDMENVTWLGLDGKTQRSAPIGDFTDDPWGSSADRYIPGPAPSEMLLIERGVFGSAAFERWAGGPSAALYLYDAASGTNFRLTPRMVAAVDPAWTPDGRRIYFAGLPEAPRNGKHRIYRINADGTGLTEIGQGYAPSVGTRP